MKGLLTVMLWPILVFQYIVEDCLLNQTIDLDTEVSNKNLVFILGLVLLSADVEINPGIAGPFPL